MAFDGHTNVHIGIQTRTEVTDLVRGDVAEAVWSFEVEVHEGTGTIDFQGPVVQGRRGERFIYLSWNYVDAERDGSFTMFGRAKAMLDAVSPALVAAALAPGAVLAGAFALSDGRGRPVFAALRPPLIEWAVERAADS